MQLGRICKSQNHPQLLKSNDPEPQVGIVSGTVVAVLLAALVGICLLWRRAQRRRGGVSPVAGSRWSKSACCGSLPMSRVQLCWSQSFSADEFYLPLKFSGPIPRFPWAWGLC